MKRIVVWSGMAGGVFIGLGLVVRALVIQAIEHYTGTCPATTSECPPVEWTIARTAYPLIFVGALFFILTVGLAVSSRFHVPKRRETRENVGVQ
jgi:formate/nitrite transporter FocA (FNT family)